jgi:uncharacterized protein (TIGR00369 family)
MNKSAKDYIDSFSKRDGLGTLLGCKFLSISSQECIYEYEARPEHYNPNGNLHGGALFSAMDSSQGAFIHYILESKYKYAATGTATVRFLAPVQEGTLRIRTWLKGTERRKMFVSSTAVDQSGNEVATLEEIWIAIPK